MTATEAIKLSQRILNLAQITFKNYQSGVGAANDFRHLEDEAEKLMKVNLNKLDSDGEKMAFWLNLYNAYIKYLIIRYQIKQSMTEKPWIFFWPKMHIGGYRFSLDDIEHGILRANSRPWYKILPQFGMPWDSRHRHACKALDYRVLFALNNGTAGSPAVKSFAAEDIDQKLDLAEYNFAKQSFQIDVKNKTIKASKLFQWYKSDFKNGYLGDPQYQGWRIQIEPYDWRIDW